MTTPTPQAMRAAEAVHRGIRDGSYSVEEAARIIDDATGLPALVEALRGMLAENSGDWKAKPCGHDFCCVCVGDKARAALAATKGGAP